ncbi:MAG: hypothetical protein LC121_02095 [Anaerolineae bacterium]|nr:hypothetical protein [Anaerolineae bacterium]
MRLHPLALLWTGAAACLAAALGLVFAAGLPDRAVYSGQILSNGRIIAPEIGALAPLFDAPTLTGTVDAAELRDAPLVINFWATWCIPAASRCRSCKPSTRRTRTCACWRSTLANRAI